ncbi:phosphoglycolate phosphatase [Nitratifractor salsuginis]|uniref:Phosphoglycolate phosphatase n=1 Tax=Nitratifractor salsuginis (strain DSM 16511 / JCM 12458 / E9I37-1) TaxID=749222 RepID=E6X160_NITSE|nr:phosphoglycolate phosphatase [Nitratifractor salsuginis]ADV45863.1 phosphoglycolate phosphatase [Nitratifractor salsuginis DSM 16511]
MRFRDRTHLLFDLDGTLIDSVPDLAKALNATLQELGLPTYDEATIRNWIGNGAAMLVKRGLAGNRQIDPEQDEALFSEAMERFLGHYERVLNDATGLYPGVAETLDALKDAGYTMAVVTNKPSQFVGPILRNLSIDSFFDVIVGGEDLPRKKPDPLPLLHACERMGCGKDQALMIGDSANDILAAQTAGIPVIAVSYGYDNGRSVRELGADEVIGEFTEILKKLQR